jgi:hypothetical protein
MFFFFFCFICFIFLAERIGRALAGSPRDLENARRLTNSALDLELLRARGGKPRPSPEEHAGDGRARRGLLVPDGSRHFAAEAPARQARAPRPERAPSRHDEAFERGPCATSVGRTPRSPASNAGSLRLPMGFPRVAASAHAVLPRRGGGEIVFVTTRTRTATIAAGAGGGESDVRGRLPQRPARSSPDPGPGYATRGRERGPNPASRLPSRRDFELSFASPRAIRLWTGFRTGTNPRSGGRLDARRQLLLRRSSHRHRRPVGLVEIRARPARGRAAPPRARTMVERPEGNASGRAVASSAGLAARTFAAGAEEPPAEDRQRALRSAPPRAAAPPDSARERRFLDEVVREVRVGDEAPGEGPDPAARPGERRAVFPGFPARAKMRFASSLVRRRLRAPRASYCRNPESRSGSGGDPGGPGRARFRRHDAARSRASAAPETCFRWPPAGPDPRVFGSTPAHLRNCSSLALAIGPCPIQEEWHRKGSKGNSLHG